MYGIRPLNEVTVGNVHRTLCKHKQTSALCATNGDRNTSNRLWTCLLQQMRLEYFEIISSVSISTFKTGQVMWRMLKYTSNP